MPRSIATPLLSAIRANSATLATCMEIVRQDKVTHRLTSHDVDIVVDGNTYRHDVPFNLSAISTNSQFAVDNVDLTLFCDGEVFKFDEFKAGYYDKADVRIFLVDWKNPELGTINLRTGWFGEIELNENKVAKVTIVGLLKVLDFDIGRVYQPNCDADLGDSRCKVAIDLSQAFDPDNPYKVGEWVYAYDESAMNAIYLVNPDFEADGNRSVNQDITGWTKSPGASFIVNTTSNSLAAYSGRSLYGTTDSSGLRREQYLYQDVDLAAAGIDTDHIDDGRITFVFRVKAAHTVEVNDPLRIYAEVYDGDGNIIDHHDSRYRYLDTFGAWRGLTLAFSVVSKARKIRLYLYMYRRSGNVANCAFDNVRAYWYDHTLGNPYYDRIHRVVRVSNILSSEFTKLPKNHSFELGGNINNSNSATIPSWERDSSADWWRTEASLAGVSRTDGSRMLIGGDDSSGTQKTYTLRQTIALSGSGGLGLDASRISAGEYFGVFRIDVVWGDTQSAAKVLLEFLNASDVVIQTVTVTDFATNASAPKAETLSSSFVVSPLAKKVRISLFARSPSNSSNAQIGFDNVRFNFTDGGRPLRSDPVQGFAGLNPTFNTNPNGYTQTGNLIFKAHTAHLQYDEVSSVIDRKTFVGTNISGGDGAYETTLIRWISGNNAGQKNIIRVWHSNTRTIKLYFPCLADIQPGDRFEYVRACQKRLREDCQVVFDNVINFRGFPYLPGRLTQT